MQLSIFDCRTMGAPFLLPDFAALRARVNSEASDWKKCPGSVDLDIVKFVKCRCSVKLQPVSLVRDVLFRSTLDKGRVKCSKGASPKSRLLRSLINTSRDDFNHCADTLWQQLLKYACAAGLHIPEDLPTCHILQTERN